MDLSFQKENCLYPISNYEDPADEWKLALESINSSEDIRNISMPDTRVWISKLTVELFFKQQYGNRKPRNMWRNKKPKEWPDEVPFIDPHNKDTQGRKPRKEDLMPIIRFLIYHYKKVNGQKLNFSATEKVSQPSEHDSGLEDDHHEIQPQPFINPKSCIEEPSSPTEVSINLDHGQHCLKTKANHVNRAHFNDRLHQIIGRLQEKIQTLPDTQPEVNSWRKSIEEILPLPCQAEDVDLRKKIIRCLHALECSLDCIYINENVIESTELKELQNEKDSLVNLMFGSDVPNDTHSLDQIISSQSSQHQQIANSCSRQFIDNNPTINEGQFLLQGISQDIFSDNTQNVYKNPHEGTNYIISIIDEADLPMEYKKRLNVTEEQLISSNINQTYGYSDNETFEENSEISEKVGLISYSDGTSAIEQAGLVHRISTQQILNNSTWVHADHPYCHPQVCSSPAVPIPQPVADFENHAMDFNEYSAT